LLVNLSISNPLCFIIQNVLIEQNHTNNQQEHFWLSATTVYIQISSFRLL